MRWVMARGVYMRLTYLQHRQNASCPYPAAELC